LKICFFHNIDENSYAYIPSPHTRPQIATSLGCELKFTYYFAFRLPLGHPDTPFNCTLLNQTTESLEVDCVEGFDGGQPQYFLLEVFDMQTGMLQANISSKFPAFSVSGLGPGMVLKMLVYAANSKGKSEPVVVEGFTLKVAEKQTGESRFIIL